MTTNKPRTAIAYYRVSTHEQELSGLGLAAQRSTVETWCKANGVVITDEVVEVQSGKSLRRRPGMTNALDRCADGEFDTLVASNVSRLARNVADLSGMLDRASAKGFALVAVEASLDTATPAGRMVVQTLAVAAEFERQMVSDRTRRALAAAAARGVIVGRPTELAANVLDEMKALRAEGLSLAQVADALNAAGYRRPRGGEWTNATVHQTLNAKRAA